MYNQKFCSIRNVNEEIIDSKLIANKQRAVKLLLVFLVINVLNGSIVPQSNPYNAPLYWSVYEHHIIKEQNGDADNYIPEEEFLANINWVETNLKNFGYDMICVDGWGDVSNTNENGYRTTHSRYWQHDFAWWSDYLQQRGMTLGMYGNPLWIHKSAADAGATIVGTDLPLSSLINEDEETLWFTWVQVDRPGAEEYVKGYINYYARMGIKYFRVDFLSWFESGYDRNLGYVGPNRPKGHYETALRWMREACDENGMFLSLVMPNLLNDAEVEVKYGHMTRINEDTGYGAWWKFSEKDRGHRYNEWSQYANPFDGFTYWSKITGRNKIILDGDFIRLNTFETDSEKRTVISLNIIAGGPVTISDQYNTISNDLWLYQNVEMLALNADGFVGQPMSNDPLSETSQTWYGQLTNGDWIVGLFNREATTREREFDFTSLGFTGNVLVRDIWQRANLGSMKSISAEIPPHGSLIIKVSDDTDNKLDQSITFNPIDDKIYGVADFILSASSTSGLPINFEVALGPAVIDNNKVQLSGQSGEVFITAYQSGNETYNAAIPKVQSFTVSGGHQPQMNIAGTFTNWNLNIPMILIDGIWVAEEVQISGGNHQLKFANTTDWSGDDWGNAIGLTGIAQLSTGGAPNISFGILETGTFNIYFNDLTLEYAIGSEIKTSVEHKDLLNSFHLFQNYPNPFNPLTTIEYTIPQSRLSESMTQHVTLRIYDVLGREVASLVDEEQSPGFYTVQWDTGSDIKSLASGTYFYRIIANDFTATKKLLLMK